MTTIAGSLSRTPTGASSEASTGPSGTDAEEAADRSPVPWSTVLPLAAVLCYADGFWVTAMRTAVGSIERTQAPFGSWLRGSTLLLPMFALAVLAALTLAQRRFGPRPRGVRQIGASLLLVSGFGSVAGVGVLVANAAYDYHLETAQVVMMDLMKGECASACQSAQAHATLVLQTKVVVVGTLIVLATNLLLVAWLVALRGGRLRLGSTRAPSALARLVEHRPGAVRGALAAALITGAVLQAIVVPKHLSQWTAVGLFFLLVTMAEFGLAGALLARRRWPALLAFVFALDGPLLLLLYARTFGDRLSPESGVPQWLRLTEVAVC